MNLKTTSGFVGAFVAGLALFAAGCRQQEPAAASPAEALPVVLVKTLVVEPRPHAVNEDVVGSIRPKLQARIEAKVTGRVLEMPVVDGQTVKAGDRLAALDVREIQAQLDQALAQQEQAERDLKRFAALVEQGAVTRQEYDAAQARSKVSSAAVIQAETMLGYAQIAAPFSGVVVRKFADVGDLAVPGKPLLELEDPSALRLEAYVPEALYGRVQRGATMAVSVASIDKVVEGTVSEISPSVDAGSRTFLVKLDLPQDAGLRSGLFGRVSVPVGTVDGIQVPTTALVVRGQMEMVFVVKDGHAQLRLVRSGKQDADTVGILSGLSGGEAVVTEGAAALRDGQPLEVK